MTNREILIKHGILPALVSDAQIGELESYLQQASNGETDTFVSFAGECFELLGALRLHMLQITRETKKSLSRTSEILEKISPSVKESMFSAFAQAVTTEELKSNFFEVTVKLDVEVRKLTSLQSECATLAKPIDCKKMTELKLRKAVLCEHFRKSPLTAQYKRLVKKAESTLSEDYSKKVLKIAELIEEAREEILKFIVEAHWVISAIEEKKRSASDFDTVVRKYQSTIHDILLKLPKD